MKNNTLIQNVLKLTSNQVLMKQILVLKSNQLSVEYIHLIYLFIPGMLHSALMSHHNALMIYFILKGNSSRLYHYSLALQTVGKE